MSKVGRASRNSSKMRVESLTTGTKTLQKAETGEVYLLDIPAAGLTVNLPTPENGQYFKFIYSDDAAGHFALSSSASSVLLKGMLSTPVLLTGAVEDDAGKHDLVHMGTLLATKANGSSHYCLNISGTSMPTAEGSYVECISDGSHWYLTGYVSGAMNFTADGV